MGDVGQAQRNRRQSLPGDGSGLHRIVGRVALSPTPILVGLSPSDLPAGASSFTMAATGRNFICNAGVSGSVVYFGPTRHTQQSCGPGPGGDMQMTVTITASEIANAGPITVTVVNPPPGGGTSLRTLFTVTAQ